MSKRIFENIFISLDEYRCSHCGKLPPDLYDEPDYRKFFIEWQNVRQLWGRPIRISSGYRCPEFQLELFKQKKTATILSPHFFYAIDNDFSTKEECLDYVNLAVGTNPYWRIGYKGYLANGQTFVHVDAAYRVRPRPTTDWQEGVRW